MTEIDSQIDDNIRTAHTISSNFYKDLSYYNDSKEKIFVSSWQFIGDTDLVKIPGQQYPFVLLVYDHKSYNNSR